MTVYELLRSNESLVRLMAAHGVPPSDVQHLAMYAEYVRMKAEGHKMMYIVGFLCDEYGVCESTVYRVAREFKKVVF